MSQTRVLVVDDHFELAELLSAALENEGISAVVACTGGAALAEARCQRPDLAIVDLVLPDMIGTELLEALAGFDPPIPTVAMSGIFRGERYDRDTTNRYGARRFFEKPFSTTALVAEILEILEELGAPPATGEVEVEGDEPLITYSWIHPDSTEERENFPDAADILGDEELVGGESPRLEMPAISPLETALVAAASNVPASEETLEASALDAPAAEENLEEEVSDDASLEEDQESASKDPVREDGQGVDPELRRRRRQMGFVEDLIEVGQKIISAMPPPVEMSETEEIFDPTSPRESIVDPAFPDRRSPLAPNTRSRGRQAPARGGELGASTVPRLLAAFHEAGSTGALEIRRSRVNKVVYLREGQPIFAASNLAGDRLLGFAVSRGVIRKEDADSALALAAEGGQRIGEILVELGVLDRRTLQRVVRDQVRAIIWSTFAWREGTYAIRAQKEGRKEPIALNLPLGTLVLEGTARAVPLLVLRQDLPDELMLAPQPAPVIGIDTLGLDAAKARILVAADGSKTVSDLLALFDEDERTVRAVLRSLWDLGVLAPREKAVSASRRIGFVV